MKNEVEYEPGKRMRSGVRSMEGLDGDKTQFGSNASGNIYIGYAPTRYKPV